MISLASEVQNNASKSRMIFKLRPQKNCSPNWITANFQMISGFFHFLVMSRSAKKSAWLPLRR